MLFYRFSKEQRFPTFLAILGIIVFWIVMPIVLWIYYKNTVDTFLEFVYKLIPYWIVVLISTLLGIVIICWCGIACHTVKFSDDGVAITTRKGKRLRYLAWKEIKVYTIAINTITYICLSTNGALPDFRKKNYGVVVALFYDKHTITLPADSAMIEYCDRSLAPYGITQEVM